MNCQFIKEDTQFVLHVHVNDILLYILYIVYSSLIIIKIIIRFFMKAYLNITFVDVLQSFTQMFFLVENKYRSSS